MRRGAAVAGSSLFFALAPGTMAGVVPWLLTRWRSGPVWLPLRLAGLALLLAASAFLVSAFVRFAVDGVGTPAPVAPTRRLVATGVYRHVRNPMYLAVTAAICGQALLLGRPVLLVYSVAFLGLTALFVRAYEEPTLARQFPTEYPAYQAAVPGWWPRRRAWTPASSTVRQDEA